MTSEGARWSASGVVASAEFEGLAARMVAKHGAVVADGVMEAAVKLHRFGVVSFAGAVASASALVPTPRADPSPYTPNRATRRKAKK